MTLRTMVMVAGLAAFAGGCAVHEHEYEERRYHSSYGVYQEDDAYEGYYYVRIVYINGDPWYVDDYRRARPVPRKLYGHFRNTAWTRSLPPRFADDDEVRDGYRVSRIVYINDVPHYVDDDHRARPVPPRVRNRFSYVTVVKGDDRGRGERPMQPGFGRGPERRMPPAFGQEREGRNEPPDYVRVRERNESPAVVRERERQEPPSYGREREREEQPGYVRMRERDESPAYGRVRDREEQPAFVRERGREEPAYRDDDARPMMTQERMREERGRPAPPFVRNGRMADEASPGRGAGGDERRPMPQDRARGEGDDRGAGAGREGPRGDDRQRAGEARGSEYRADSAPDRRRGNGRGRDRSDEDSNGEGGRNGRGNR